MNILMLSPVPVAPADTGGKVRIHQMANGLAQYHKITLIAPVYQKFSQVNKPSSEYKENIADKMGNSGPISTAYEYQPVTCEPPHTGRHLCSLFSLLPYHTALRYRKPLAHRVQMHLDEHRYDLIYCHFIQTLPYVAKTNAEPANVPIVLDQHNVDRIYWQRQMSHHQKNPLLYWLSRRNCYKTIRFETEHLTRLSGIVSVSSDDRIATRQYAEGQVPHFLVAPNGADTNQYQLGSANENQGKFVLGFLGSMELQSNQKAAFRLVEEILPTIQQRHPDIEISALIIGRNPPQRLLQFAQSHPERRIIITGTVDQVLPYLHRVDVLALPLESGAGTKLRVLEAMAAGICVVGSPIALAGFDHLVPGKHALWAREDHEFIVAISTLVQDRAQLQTFRDHAHKLVNQRYSWVKITQKLAEELSLITATRDISA